MLFFFPLYNVFSNYYLNFYIHLIIIFFFVMSYVFEDKMEDQANLTQQRLLELQQRRFKLEDQLVEAIDKQNDTKATVIQKRIDKIDEEILRLDNMLAAAQGMFFNIYFVFHY